MASRFEQWKKENQLLKEDATSIEPNQPSESIDDFRNKIDNMLKMAFDKIKKDIINTFGRDIRDQVRDTRKLAVDYLNKALMNLTGTNRYNVSPTNESYYQELAFNKLNRMFNEVEAVTQPTGDVVSNVKKSKQITDYLDTMRSAIMKHVDRMLVAARNDHIFKSVENLSNKLDKHGNRIDRVRSHITSKVGGLHDKISNIASSSNALSGDALHNATDSISMVTMPDKLKIKNKGQVLSFDHEDRKSIYNALSSLDNPQNTAVEYHGQENNFDFTTSRGLSDFETWVQQINSENNPLDFSRTRKKISQTSSAKRPIPLVKDNK